MSTQQAVRARITALLDAVNERMGYLHSRWQDEQQYEDFADYAQAMRVVVPAGFTFVRATRRPFGFEFRIDAFPDALFRVRATSRSISAEHLGGSLRPVAS